MQPIQLTHPSSLMRSFIALLSTLLLLLMLCATALAQTSTGPTDGSTPLGMSPGSPAGSYALSGFDNVNPYNGKLGFHLPLLRVGGRGQAGYTITLPIETHWQIRDEFYGQSHHYYPMPDEWSGLVPGYGAGVLVGRLTGIADGSSCPSSMLALTRLTFTTSDGTEYELRDTKYAGVQKENHYGGGSGQCDIEMTTSRGRVFTTADGTSATFISDTEISDFAGIGITQITPSGYLLLANGTRYRIVDGRVTWIRDANGNQLTFGGGVLVTDSLGRQVTLTTINDAQGYRVAEELSYKGMGGATRTLRVNYSPLSQVLRAGYEIQSPRQLFPNLNTVNNAGAASSTPYNPSVVSSVEMPDSSPSQFRGYRFKYNSYGELARVELPTGGAFEYDYDWGTASGSVQGTLGSYRRVMEKRIYTDGVTLANRTIFGRAEEIDTDKCSVEVVQRDANGVLLGKEKHYYYGRAKDSFYQAPTGYPRWKDGKEYQTETFDTALDANGQASIVLKRVEQTWQQPVAGQDWPLGQAETGDYAYPNNPQVTQVLTTIEPQGGNLVTRQTFSYDRYCNKTDTYEYDYGVGQAGALLRHTQTTFVKTTNSQDYACDPSTTCDYNTLTSGINSSVIHLRSLPLRLSIYDSANTEQARTVFEYDNYSTQEGHAALVARSQITGLCDSINAPQCTLSDPTVLKTRGNLTATTSYTDAAAQTGAVTTYVQYDVAGNVVKKIDARGKESSITYGDSFCNGSTCGGTYTPNTFAFPTSRTSPIPDLTGQFGSTTALTTSTVYDFWTGAATSRTDANNQTTTLEYTDALDRLTRITRPGDTQTGGGGHTTFEYGDTVGNLYLRARTTIDAARSTDSFQYFDGLGRASHASSYEGQEASLSWLSSDTQYDALGRAWRVSKSYRASSSTTVGDPNNWTETSFDALGRVTQVKTTADGAVVSTVYAGQFVTVMDQAGKVRRSKTDALGRLVRVDEPDASGNLGEATAPLQPTSYTYDALGNLRRVAQGTQQRSFMYDSLSRLIRAKNPEQAANNSLTLSDAVTGNNQWSMAYAYDQNGNLVSRTDARNLTTTYTYDALNRNTKVDYPAGTKDIERHYDGATNGRGRFFYFNWDPSDNTRFDTHLAVDEYDRMGRIKQYRQHFLTNGTASAAFIVERTYDSAGNVTSQKYPSGHTVNYSYDAMGRLADAGGEPAFKGTLGDGILRTYASEIRYEERGSMEQERFGTAQGIYNKHLYNSRGQLAEIRVSTHSILEAGDLRTDWNRGAIINHYSNAIGTWGATGGSRYNNGNLLRQDVYIPATEPNTSNSLTTQYFSYDSLNRLAEVYEKRNGQGDKLWQQVYNYDRWGNRTIDAASTWEGNAANPPSAAINEKQFETSELSATNRLLAPGDAQLSEAQRRMRYDSAGNLTRDTYSSDNQSLSTFVYDAENRLREVNNSNGQAIAIYTYDAEGRRVKRNTGGQEIWQIYGIDSELLAEYAAQSSPSTSQKEYGYRAGELLVAAESSSATSTTSATFLTTDTSTQGDWKNRYGADGYAVAGDATSYPAYAQVTLGGESSGIWAASTSDIRALQKSASGSADRVAAVWSSATTFTFDINLTDARSHQVALYCLDFDGSNQRAQTVEVFDAATNALLDSRTLSSFSNGKYLVWQLKGHLLLRVTRTGSWNGVVSGLFFGAANAATFVQSDTTTQGTWKGVYGSDGYSINSDATSYPAYAQVTMSGQQTGTWTTSTTDVRGLQKAAQGSAERVAGAWSSANSFTFDINLIDGQAHRVALYCVDWDGANQRAQTVEVLNAATNTVIDSRSVSNFSSGQWLVWDLRGHTLIRVTRTGSWNGVASGLFFSTQSANTAGGEVAVQWLVNDQLGTPRMVIDESGSLSGLKRHDYLPFGEEIGAVVGGRTTGQGYSQLDGVRQKFTGYERDNESGLDYAQARYYASAQGRFTSPDPILSSGKPLQPQSWNRYSYTLNNPLKYVDPLGLIWGQKDGDDYYRWFDTEDAMKEAGYTAATRFVYEINGTWYAVNPNANQWKSFNNDWDAKRTYWGWTGLESSWQDWVPVWGQFRRMLFNMATDNYEGALGNFAMASIDGGTLAAGAMGKGGVTAASFADDAARAVADDGMTTLYRAVSNAEFEQIMKDGVFKAGPNSLGGKWFAESAEHAAQWGQKLEGTSGFRIVDVRVPTAQANKFMRIERLDGIGPARYAELNQLSGAKIGVVK